MWINKEWGVEGCRMCIDIRTSLVKRKTIDNHRAPLLL